MALALAYLNDLECQIESVPAIFFAVDLLLYHTTILYFRPISQANAVMQRRVENAMETLSTVQKSIYSISTRTRHVEGILIPPPASALGTIFRSLSAVLNTPTMENTTHTSRNSRPSGSQAAPLPPPDPSLALTLVDSGVALPNPPIPNPGPSSPRPSASHTSLSPPCELSEEDILYSPLIPAVFKESILDRHRQLVYILTTHERTGFRPGASGSTEADRVIAAEQLAGMSLVFDFYADSFKTQKEEPQVEEPEGVDDGSCESMTIDMLDAGWAASGLRQTFDQPVFVAPPCISEKKRELAKLTSWCLQRYPRHQTSTAIPQTAPALSADSILRRWAILDMAAPLGRESMDLSRPIPVTVQLVPAEAPIPRRRRAASDGDILHAAQLVSAGLKDLDDSVWTKCAEEARSPTEEIEIFWPPPTESLEGLCLVEKISRLAKVELGPTFRQRLCELASSHVRRALHPWCLRCYQIRRRSRDYSLSSACDAVFDALFMFSGIIFVVAVETFIAWPKYWAPKFATVCDGIRIVGSSFLKEESHEAESFGMHPIAPLTPRRRAISDP